jgi:hypothetical protein
MNPKELRGLYEAYSEVYAPQEDVVQIDEAEGSYGATPKAYSAASKTKMTAKRKPFLRAMKSRTNPAGTSMPNTARKGMTVDDRERARAGAAYGVGTRQDHDYPSEGPGGVTKSAKKLRKQKALGEIGEGYDIFDVVLEFLQVEGFVETLEEAEWMMANIIDEEAIAIIAEASCEDDEEEMKKGKKSKKSEEDDEDEEELDEAIYSRKGLAKAAEMIAKRSTPSGRAKSGKGADVAHIKQIRGSGRGDFDREGLGGTPMTPTMAKNPIKKQNYIGTGNKAERRAGTYKEAFEAWLDEAMSNYEKNRKRAAQRAAARNAARDQGKTGAVPGVGYVTPRRERETWTDESGKTRHAKGL